MKSKVERTKVTRVMPLKTTRRVSILIWKRTISITMKKKRRREKKRMKMMMTIEEF